MKRSFSRPPRDWQQYPSVQLPERWPLATSVQARNVDFDKDARLINCYAELNPQNQEFEVEKRPGYSDGVALGSGAGRGIFKWVPYNVVGGAGNFTVVATEMYKNGVLFGTVAGTGKVYFTTMLEGPYMVLGAASTTAYFTDSTTLTTISDAEFPTTDRCPGFAYLDGAVYVLRYDGAIQGSDIGDPSAWDPLNVIIARNNPDQGVVISRQLSYIIAFKQWSTEFFENVGNPTGSPLAPVEGAQLNYGCSSADSLVEMDGTLLWVVSNRDASPQVARLDNLSLEIISTPFIERLLRSVSSFTSATVRAVPLKVGGHRFYILSISTLPVSLVYDLDQKLWAYWTNESGTAVWPFGSVTGDILTDNTIFGQIVSNGVIFTIDADYVEPTDNGAWIPVDIYTPNFDFGVDRIKQLNVMRFNADQTPGSSLSVRYSDNDYTTWSNFRKVDLSVQRPTLTDLGSFYRRAFNIRHQAPTPMRIRSADIQTDIGTF